MKYQIVRSGRRTLALEMKKDGSLLVRAPYAATEKDIEELVSSHHDWIEKHRAHIEARSLPPLTVSEERSLRARALADLPARTARWAERMGITYAGVKITAAKHRFGSCSSRGGISYSYRLMQFPEEVIDYVVVHELAHRRQMNHSSAFYAIVAEYLPDYKRRVGILKTFPRAL